MTPELAIAIVEARLLGPESIPVRLRTRAEVTETEIAELMAAIDSLIAHYQDRETVPKKLAAAFVDIYNGFIPAEGAMSTEQAQRLEDARLPCRTRPVSCSAPELDIAGGPWNRQCKLWRDGQRAQNCDAGWSASGTKLPVASSSALREPFSIS